jgi:hypothetical protein
VGERFGIAAILDSFAASKITQQQHASILIALGFHGRFFAFFRSAFYAHFAHQTAQVPPGTHAAAHSLAELLHCSLCRAQWRRQLWCSAG